jgi:hypothetical protein
MHLIVSGCLAMAGAAYFIWLAIQGDSPQYFSTAAFLYLTGAGLFQHRRWAPWFMLALTLMTFLSWVATVAQLALTDWPYDSVGAAIIGLAMSLIWIVVWGFAGVLAVQGMEGDTVTESGKA